jgi:diguanylate cyclase (GGDEF)-like protein
LHIKNKKIVESLVYHKVDSLTQLPNKNALMDDLKTIKKPILFYLNIDDFMSLNNLYGNEMGDRVLLNMANILREITKGEACSLYRVYNDEFLVLCEEGSVNMDNYAIFFSKLIDNIEINSVGCTQVDCISFTLSGGVSCYTHDTNYENLSIYASIARNMAKVENKKFLLYSHDMQNNEDYAKNMMWIKRIKEAIANNQFFPYFQPIVDNHTGKVVKYEALVRMIDGEGKCISPFFFLEIAKKAKLYEYITRVVIDKTFKVFKDEAEYSCSINLSTEDIMSQETRHYIYTKLKSYPHPEKIVFEITESEEIRDLKTVNLFISGETVWCQNFD